MGSMRLSVPDRALNGVRSAGSGDYTCLGECGSGGLLWPECSRGKLRSGDYNVATT